VLDRPVTRFQIFGTTFLPADLNRAGRVDGQDLAVLAASFDKSAF
jgi:hypothetical protein